MKLFALVLNLVCCQTIPVAFESFLARLFTADSIKKYEVKAEYLVSHENWAQIDVIAPPTHHNQKPTLTIKVNNIKVFLRKTIISMKSHLIII